MLVDSNILIYATKPEHSKLRQWLIDTLPKASIISKVEILGYHKLHSAEKAALTELTYVRPLPKRRARYYFFPLKGRELAVTQLKVVP